MYRLCTRTFAFLVRGVRHSGLDVVDFDAEREVGSALILLHMLASRRSGSARLGCRFFSLCSCRHAFFCTGKEERERDSFSRSDSLLLLLEVGRPCCVSRRHGRCKLCFAEKPRTGDSHGVMLQAFPLLKKRKKKQEQRFAFRYTCSLSRSLA